MTTENIQQNVLQPDYHLLWYRIKRVLGRGSFGITYLAYDITLDRLVAIKEYMPAQLAIRANNFTVQPITPDHEEDFKFGLGRFISEGRTLTRFEHSNLVRVYNAFENNNTAYMVMNYEIGENLHEFIKRNKTLSELEIMQIIMPLLDGLKKMHAQGFIHRDIKPGNIFIRASDGSPVLLDFGSARQIRHASVHSLTNLVSPGYAPIEQYTSNSDKQGPWTDIYGLGATIYKIITGSPPMNAVDRGESITSDGWDNYISLQQLLPAGYSKKFLAAIDHALVFKASDRPQFITEWMVEFMTIAHRSDTRADPGATEDIFMLKIDETPKEKKSGSTHSEKTVKINKQNIPGSEKSRKRMPVIFPKQFLVFSATNKKTITTTIAALAIIITTILVLIPEQNGELVTVVDMREPDSETSGIITTLPDTTNVPDPAAGESRFLMDNPLVTEAVNDDETAEIQQLLSLANTDISELRLTSPPGNNAYEVYQRVLTLEPDNEQARAGTRAISDKYIALAYGAIRANKTDRAGLYIQKASETWPESDKIALAKEALQSKVTELSKLEEENKGTNVEYLAPVEDHSHEQITSVKSDKESDSLAGGVNKWFRGTAEKNKDTGQQQGTGDSFVQSIGGDK